MDSLLDFALMLTPYLAWSAVAAWFAIVLAYAIDSFTMRRAARRRAQ